MIAENLFFLLFWRAVFAQAFFCWGRYFLSLPLICLLLGCNSSCGSGCALEKCLGAFCWWSDDLNLGSKDGDPHERLRIDLLLGSRCERHGQRKRNFAAVEEVAMAAAQALRFQLF